MRCSFPVLAAALQVGWEMLKGPSLLYMFSLLTTCMFLFSLEQKYLHYKQCFEAPVRIMVSSSQMLFSCMMPFKHIMLSIA